MSYLVDTNVFCELTKSKPNKSVIKWFQSIPEDSIFLSTLVLGEIQKGIMQLNDEKRSERIRLWLNFDLTRRFGNRILGIDNIVTTVWGELIASTARTLPAIDSLIAATAIAHDLKIVTRNTKDFNLVEVVCVNPWEAAALAPA